MFFDDIAAIATPSGESGIAIIRTSGKNVFAKIEKIFLPNRNNLKIKDKSSHTLTLGWIINKSGEKIDQVLLSIMRGPNSYTGEDVAEINLHGGYFSVKACLQLCLEAGFRIAEPGEFTKRAFLNGKIDLSQAEAVIDLIRVKSEKGLQLAVRQLQGTLSKYIDDIENDLIKLNALIAASIDFPDEVGDLDQKEASYLIYNCRQKLEKLISIADKNEVYREGINMVICGKPNVGKSSLLNRLLGKEKAIVTSIPGTTRDIVEDFLSIKGIPVRVMDTAGIRKTDDYVEQIGVEKSKTALKNADIVLFLLDKKAGITGEDLEIFQQIKDINNIIILLNKDDLMTSNTCEKELQEFFNGVKVIRGSVKEDKGIDELENSIEQMVLSGEAESEAMETMINIRQKDLLLKCKEQIDIISASLNSVTLDCLDVEVGTALDYLGEISGKSLKEDVIDKIFRDFCIGK